MSLTREIKGTIYHIHHGEKDGCDFNGATTFYYHAGGNIIRSVSVGDDVMCESNYYNSRNGYFRSPEACV